MIDKGYDHPLHSLNLIPAGNLTDDNERYSVPDPHGLLVISTDLRLRAADYSADRCYVAAATALAYHAHGVAGFTVYGLDAEWAENLRYWNNRLNALSRARGGLLTDCQLNTYGRAHYYKQAKSLWQRLTLASQIARCPGTVTTGPAPRALPALCAALAAAQVRAHDRAAILAGNGFGPEQQAELAAVVAALQADLAGKTKNAWSQKALTDQLTVIRGAIIGDVVRLSRAAPHALFRSLAEKVRMRRLFPKCHPRKTGTAPAQAQETHPAP
jgi:hypothetical protein